MKKIVFLMLFLINIALAFAQDRDRDREYRRDSRSYSARGDVPERVWNSFHRDYPNAEYPQWQHLGKEWHATYKDRDHGGRNVETYYDRRGRRIDSHIEWNRRELPEDFDQHIYDRYHTRDYEVYRIERSGRPSIFQIILNLDNGRRSIFTDEYGNEIRFRDRH